MKKLLAITAAMLLFAFAAAQNNKTALQNDAKNFTDKSCSKLKPNVKSTDTFQSQALKQMAQKMLSNQYESQYLAAEYEAYPSTEVIEKTLKLGDGFSKYENMTGVFLGKGEHIVMVGKTNGRKIKLLLPNLMRKPAEGVKPTEDPNGWNLHKTEIELTEGANIINVEIPTNAYISYFENDYKKAPKIKVHFVTGKVNGYFDTTRGDTNEDWNKLLANAVSPIMDARGKHIQVAYPVEWFNVYTTGKGVELMSAYDAMLNAQYTLMGLVKYNKVPKNRLFARVNFNYYMFRDGDGVAYLGDKGTMRMVADPSVVTVGDPCWGFSHEVGHAMQMDPITWGGMTEVSNNIFSLYTTAAMGNKVSRIKEQKNYDKAREAIIGKNISYLHDKDVFNRLVPFWQLQLHFSTNGHPDFYADVMEQMRLKAKDYKGDQTINYQFDFIKICCDVTKSDLADFFEKWGFFWTGNIKLEDYASYNFDITPEMVAQTKEYISSKGYAKPSVDLTQISE